MYVHVVIQLVQFFDAWSRGELGGDLVASHRVALVCSRPTIE